MDRFTECIRTTMQIHQCIDCKLADFCDDPNAEKEGKQIRLGQQKLQNREQLTEARAKFMAGKDELWETLPPAWRTKYLRQATADVEWMDSQGLVLLDKDQTLPKLPNGTLGCILLCHQDEQQKMIGQGWRKVIPIKEK